METRYYQKNPFLPLSFPLHFPREGMETGGLQDVRKIRKVFPLHFPREGMETLRNIRKGEGFRDFPLHFPREGMETWRVSLASVKARHAFLYTFPVRGWKP